MKFGPVTKNLCADAASSPKKLGCPLVRRWEQLQALDRDPHRRCAECERSVLDIPIYGDD